MRITFMFWFTGHVCLCEPDTLKHDISRFLPKMSNAPRCCRRRPPDDHSLFLRLLHNATATASYHQRQSITADVISRDNQPIPTVQKRTRVWLLKVEETLFCTVVFFVWKLALFCEFWEVYFIAVLGLKCEKSAGFCEDHVTCLLIDGGYLLSISDTFVYWLGIRATWNDILMSAWSEVINSTCRQLGIITLAVSFLIDHNIWSSFIWNVLKRSITAICTILTWNWNSLHL